jgi:hypothetical protein
VRHRVAGAHFQRGSKGQRGLGVPPHAHQRETEVVVNGGVVQAKPNRCQAAFCREVVPAKRAVDLSESRSENRHLRPQGDCPADQFGGCLGLAHLMPREAEQMKGVDMIWLALQAQIIEPSGRRRLASLMKLNRFGELVA